MTEVVTIPKDEYTILKNKEEITDDALKQIKLSLQDIKENKVHRVL